jgi:MFS transporter, DHA1 family, multidrug resistance protein
MSYLHDLYQQWRCFPRTIKLFYCADIFFAFAQAIFATLFNLHLLEIGYTAGHIGLLQSLAALLTALIAVPIGLAGDRWGRRGLYVAGSILFSVPYMIMPWATSYPLLMGVFIVNTIGNTLMFVNESPLLAGEVSPDLRAGVFSFMMINFFIWNTLGIQLAGFLVDWLPRGALSRYEWALVVAGASGVTAGIIRSLLPFRRETPTRRGLNLRPSRATLLLALSSLLAGAYMAMTQNFNNVVLAERFQYSSASISTILTVAGVVGWFGSVLVPWTSRRLGDMKAYALVVGLQGLALAYMGFAGSPSTFLPGFWIRAVLGTMQMSLFNTFAMGVTPDDQRATANSYAMVGRNLGSAMAAKGYGAALAAGSFVLPFSVAGLCAVATAIFTLLAFRRHPVIEADPIRAQ